MLRSISSSISLVKMTSLIDVLSGLRGSFADLEKLEGVRTGGGDAVVLVLLAVVFAQRVPLPVVRQEQAPEVGVPLEKNAEKVVALALLPIGNRPHVDERRDGRILAGQERLHHQPMAKRMAVEVVYDDDLVLPRVVYAGEALPGVDREPS